MTKAHKQSHGGMFKAVFLSLALLAAAGSASVQAQATLDFWANTPVADLNKDQLNSLYGAIKTSLDAGVDGKTSTWHSDAPGTQSATITPHFKDKAKDCANVDLKVKSKGKTQPLKLAYCKSDKGEWLLHNH